MREKASSKEIQQRNLEYFLWRSLYHFVDGPFLDVHRFHLQRRFLKIDERLWGSMEG